MINGYPKASLTIFASLTLMLVVSVLFTMLEGSHYVELIRVGRINAASVTESAFAGYLEPLWDNYHLLGRAVSGEDGMQLDSLESELLQLSRENMYPVNGISWHTNWLQMNTTDVEFTECVLMTDDDGAAFEAACADYLRNVLLFTEIQELLNNSSVVEEVMQNSANCEDIVMEAKSSIEETGEDPGENLISDFEGTAEKGILETVVRDPDRLSVKAIETDAAVSRRILSTGVHNAPVTCDMGDTVLMDVFLLSQLGSYEAHKENRALDYELEYLIAGEGSDVENLKKVVNEILLIREAANFAYALTNPEMNEAALALGETLATLLLNPELGPVFQYAILAVWAYGESILDLRALLAGERVPAFKSQESWTSDLSMLGQLGSDFVMAKSSKTGLGYQDYLGILLIAQRNETVAYRSMDVMEATVRSVEGYEDFRMDHLVLEGSLCFQYESGTIFGTEGTCRYGYTTHYSYRKAVI